MRLWYRVALMSLCEGMIWWLMRKDDISHYVAVALPGHVSSGHESRGHCQEGENDDGEELHFLSVTYIML